MTHELEGFLRSEAKPALIPSTVTSLSRLPAIKPISTDPKRQCPSRSPSPYRRLALGFAPSIHPFEDDVEVLPPGRAIIVGCVGLSDDS